MSEKIRIGFLGSGHIACPVLDALVHAPDIELVLLNTQPDKPAARGKLTPTPVRQYALDRQLECHCESVNSEAFDRLLRERNPDLIVVIDFGQILRKPVLDAPKFGCLNIHASILPRYRGASPIQSVLLAGDDVTGVSFMQMDEGLDTGAVFMTFVTPVPPRTTAEALLETLGALSAAHAPKMIQMIVQGKVTPIPQSRECATICRKIKKRDGLADFNAPVESLCRKVYAYSPWPGLYFTVAGGSRRLRLRVTNARVFEDPLRHTAPVGSRLNFGPKRLVFAGSDGCFEVETLIPEGKKEMSASAFLNGASWVEGIVPEDPSQSA